MKEFLKIKSLPVESVRGLRHAILRPGLPIEHSYYPGDKDGYSRHFGALYRDELVGVLTVLREVHPALISHISWRIRGLAVKEKYRRKGIGKSLVEASVQYTLSQGGGILWCNGRVSAMEFYLACGFTPIGEQFNIPESGPHYVFWRKLDSVPIKNV